MAVKKAKKQAKIEKAIAASVKRSEERAKIITPGKKATDLSNVSRSDLIVQMGEAAYELGVLQDQLGNLQRKHAQQQTEVQQIKIELDKRSGS